MSKGARAEPGADYNAAALAQNWAGVCDPKLEFRHSALKALLNLWQSAKSDAITPKRSAMNLRLLRSHIPDVAIYERKILENGAHRYRVRLMGAQFAEVTGDLTGKFLDEKIPKPYLQRWNAALDAVLDCGQPLRFVSRAETAGKPFLVGEFLEAPLLNDDGAMNMILAGAIFVPVNDWEALLSKSTDSNADRALEKTFRSSKP